MPWINQTTKIWKIQEKSVKNVCQLCLRENFAKNLQLNVIIDKINDSVIVILLLKFDQVLKKNFN